jgi:acid phosphatase type 7
MKIHFSFPWSRTAFVVSTMALLTVRATAANSALSFDGANDYVTFGAAPPIGATTFTIETWFKRTGAGASASTGSGGVTAIPLVAKGRGEADGTTQDMNYFLGIRASDNVLVADFEEGAGGATPGLNHPVAGLTPVPANTWTHAAVTYDGATWRLYLNGNLEAQLSVGRPPRSDSIQHASLASALNSTGAAAGFFAGALDEARIWNYARTAQQIADSKNLEIVSAPGLIGRWGLNESSGTAAGDSSGNQVNGTLVNGPGWTSGFDPNSIPTPILTRGPYLQLGTPTSTVVRWRTDIATIGRVRFGAAAGSLNSIVDEPVATTEHIVTVSNLSPDTLYYYAVGTTNVTLAGDAPSFFFGTSPRAGSAVPTRIWVLGDSGTQNAAQYAVRDAYYSYTGTRQTDLWLMLGDNAYNSGTDAEFQGAVFNAYPATLRNSVLWPTLGNHDTAQSTSFVDTYPYFQMFTLPKNGEAGGVASGTEHYYSFDFGNIHLICLDSMTANRATDGAMANWLRADLANTLRDWTIAFWHHPPYSKGSHDSDTATELKQMRVNFLPILEGAGVDLVLGGHSHSYERSYLLDGHYDVSTTLSTANIVDGGSGRLPSPYQKPAGAAARAGAVYTVAGSSGQISGGALNHPAMYLSLNVLGSLVIDVLTNQMNVTFVDNAAVARDTFTILKSGSVSGAAKAPSGLTASGISSSEIGLTWQDNSMDEDGFEVERSMDGNSFNLIATLGSNALSFTDSGLQRNRRYYYRVRAFNPGGSSVYSNVASAKTRAH